MIILIQFIVTQALDMVRRRFQVLVRQQEDGDLVAQFDSLDIGPLFVEQEGRHIHRHLGVHGGRVFLHRFLFEDAQDVQRG